MERSCPLCDCPNEPMGSLGSRAHYRCRACGIIYSHPVRRVNRPKRKKRQAVWGFGIETVG